jgi:hypothetical protein
VVETPTQKVGFKPGCPSITALTNAEATLYSIPLNNTFPSSGLLPANAYRDLPAPGVEYHGEGTFFKDGNDTILYSMNGFQDPSTPTNQLLAFNTVTQGWFNATVSGGDFNFDTRAAALHAISSGQGVSGLGFVSGGWEDVPGMIRFNATDANNLHWTNETSNNPPLTLEGGMEFVRYGKQGSLIAFGG